TSAAWAFATRARESAGDNAVPRRLCARARENAQARVARWSGTVACARRRPRRLDGTPGRGRGGGAAVVADPRDRAFAAARGCASPDRIPPPRADRGAAGAGPSASPPPLQRRGARADSVQGLDAGAALSPSGPAPLRRFRSPRSCRGGGDRPWGAPLARIGPPVARGRGHRGDAGTLPSGPDRIRAVRTRAPRISGWVPVPRPRPRGPAPPGDSPPAPSRWMAAALALRRRGPARIAPSRLLVAAVPRWRPTSQ